MFKLTGSNLFMIPCEVKNESFGELFKRMITKNGILCIALYRKNLVDNFYYVYTNPRKTTLIKETDFIFILAGTASIDKYYEHYESNIDNKKEKESEFNKGERKEEKNKQLGTQSEINFGSQIRSYVLEPYKLVKDNRSNFESGEPEKILDGDLEKLLNYNLKNIGD